jgi:hypothetical protein
MIDATQNWAWSTNITYGSSLSSAEWIEEDTQNIGGAPTAMANYGSVAFSGLTANRLNPNLTPITAIAVDQPGNTNNYISVPSAPIGGNSFSVCYQGGGQTPINCAPPSTLADFAGGTVAAPRALPLVTGDIGVITSTIVGPGVSDFYSFFWPGNCATCDNSGVFDAVATISGANWNDSYQFELLCDNDSCGGVFNIIDVLTLRADPES